MEIVSDQNYEVLRGLVFSNRELAVRLRAQVVVLYEKGFQVSQIEKVVEKSRMEVYTLLKYVEFFGIEDYLIIKYEELEKKVKDEIFRREQEKVRRRKKGFLYYLFWPITSIFHTLFHIKGIFLAFFTLVFVGVIRFFSTFKPRPENENVATFEKGASNNYLIQINKLIINDKGEKIVVDDKYIANSQEQLERKIQEIIESNEKITFNNATIDSLIQMGRKKDHEGNLDKSRAKLFATLIVAYLLYSSSFKGGVWTISVFGMAIVITLRSCNPFVDKSSTNVSPIANDSTFIPDKYSKKITPHAIDSIRNRLQESKPIEIYDYATYFSIIEDFFESDRLCNALSAVGDRQNSFIYEYDKVNHKEQNYYIDTLDQKYYIHVVAYDDIRQAAFQMHYLNYSGVFKAKILRVFTNDSILYAVVIGEYQGDQIKDICDLVETWKASCLNDNVDIGCYFNG